MSALAGLIKRIGIFMIAAQAVIHFTPGQKYEKYVKLLVGMMILLQFAAPLHGIFQEAGTDWDIKLSEMARTLETASSFDETAGSVSVMESVMKSLENEIKSRLNSEISEEYIISNVQVSLKTPDESGESPAGTKQYELEKIRVAVYRRTASAGRMDENAGNTGNAVEKVQIGKISVCSAKDSEERAFGDADGNGGPLREEKEETAEQLRERFCAVLGMDREKMEVSVYGTNEKAD
ncbi:MAG: stage III sporulation protein AF [Blautia sp.]|nr:stage III sporulation protein AF [Blautia sp.]MCM1201519.1 stage III sporulation protein AF [Bacteroides fragilis]